MHVDESKCLVMQNNKKAALIYDKVLNKICSLKTTQEVDEYLSNISEDVAENRSEKLRKFGLTKALACEQLLEYSPDANRDNALTFLSLQLNDETTLLQTILSRLFNDGFHVPHLEFQRILEVALLVILRNENYATIFEMTFMSSSQKEWSAKLCWSVMEEYFIDASKSEMTQLRDQLELIKHNLNIITLAWKIAELQDEQLKPKVVIDIMKTFNEFKVDVIESLIETSLTMWKSMIIEKFWSTKFISLQDKKVINEEDSEMARLYLSTFKTTFGYELVKELVELFEERHQQLEGVDIRAILVNFYNSEWLLTEQTMKILRRTQAADWIQELNKHFASNVKTRRLADIKRYVEGDIKTSENCRDKLPFIEQDFKMLAVMKCEDIYDKKFSEFTIADVDEWLENVFDGESTSKLEALAVIIRVFELVTEANKNRIGLRDVQIFAILQLMHSKKGVSAQISTGEGKSFIAAAFAILKALYGEYVDIITSSSFLAVRDVKDETIKGLFEAFKVSFGNNCAGSISERKEIYNKHSVIYGTLSNFQRDYLLDKFFDLNVMSTHQLQNVIIDEADSMLLDKGSNILYLSQELPDMDSLTSLFIFIWSWINQPVTSTKEREQNLNKKLIKEIVINEMLTIISKNDIKSFDSELSESQINEIWNNLKSTELISNRGKILKSDVTEQEIAKIIPEKCKYISSKLVYLIDKTMRRYRQFSIPTYLESFVLMHLNSFIESALKALEMQIDSEYIVDKPDRATDDIVILDIDTGTEQLHSQWDQGLHQFLQLKHGCKVSSLSLKSVFISNVSYIKLYRDSIYGISGTLGSHFERNKLLKLYDIDFITIPTYRAKSFVEEKPIIASTTEDWINQICEETVKVCKTRSVLIICETISNVQVIRRKLLHLVENISAIRRSQEILYFKSTISIGKVIVSTNLAGRGMDLKLDEKCKKAGGLHVILSYLPTNIRVEQQAFGRAARGGAPGSGRLIIHIKDQPDIIDAKRVRDDNEHKRLEELTKYYENFIRVEEKLFDKFNEAYKEMKGDDQKIKIQKENFLFNWAFWIDENNKLLNVDENKNYDELISKLDQFILLHKTFDMELPTTHPTCQIKLLKYFLSKKDFKNSEILFKKLRDEKRCNMDVLSYYTFFIITKHLNQQQSCMPKNIPRDYHDHLKESLRRFESRKKLREYSQAMLASANRKNEMRGFDDYNKTLDKLDDIFITSIHSLLGAPVTSELFSDKFIGSNESCNQLYEILLQLKVINYPRIAKSFDHLQCKKICEKYFIEWTCLDELLSTERNKDIDIDEFTESLKRRFPLPSREDFWDLLILKKVLVDEAHYAIIEKNSIQIFDAEFLETVQQHIDNKKIDLKSRPKASAETIFFNSWCEKNVVNDSNDKYENVKMVFNLSALKDIMDSDLESYIKEQCITINKSAKVNLINAAACTFKHFDSITIDDLKTLNLNDETATAILTSLIEQRVIAKSSTNPKIYNLFSNNFRILNLGNNDVYKEDVERLIEHRFAYRIALNRLITETTKNRIISIKSNPHLCLFSDMIESSVVQYGKVEKRNIRRIDDYHINFFSESKIIEFFTNHGLDSTKINLDLIQHLCAKKMLSNRLFGTYSIEPFINRKTKLDTQYQDIEGRLMLILKNHNTVRLNWRAIKQILIDSTGTLDPSQMSCPKISLELLNSFIGDLTYTDEFNALKIQGFDAIIKVSEKQWSLSMLLKTSFVFVMGIIEVVLALVLMIYSKISLMTSIKRVWNGIGDIIFAIDCFQSGFFSWKDYARYKLSSKMVSEAFAWIKQALYIKKQFVILEAIEVFSSKVDEIFNSFIFQSIDDFLESQDVAKLDHFLNYTVSSELVKLKTSIENIITSQIQMHPLYKMLQASSKMKEADIKTIIRAFVRKGSHIHSVTKIMDEILSSANHALESVLSELKSIKEAAEKHYLVLLNNIHQELLNKEEQNTLQNDSRRDPKCVRNVIKCADESSKSNKMHKFLQSEIVESANEMFANQVANKLEQKSNEQLIATTDKLLNAHNESFKTLEEKVQNEFNTTGESTQTKIEEEEEEEIQNIVGKELLLKYGSKKLLLKLFRDYNLMNYSVMNIAIEIVAYHLNISVDCKTRGVLIAQTENVSKTNLTKKRARNLKKFYRALQLEYPEIENILSESKLKELILSQLDN